MWLRPQMCHKLWHLLRCRNDSQARTIAVMYFRLRAEIHFMWQTGKPHVSD